MFFTATYSEGNLSGISKIFCLTLSRLPQPVLLTARPWEGQSTTAKKSDNIFCEKSCCRVNLLAKMQCLKTSLCCLLSRRAEVAREHGWHPPKSLDPDKNLIPEHTLFCCKLRFVAIYALFGDLWAKKVPFGVKNSVSWARSALLHGIYCIFHWVNFANLRLREKTTHLTRKL